MAAYDAFVSYSHAKDKPIAAALQTVVQRLGKPWYRRRALRVFRDDTSLSATPSLWPSIEQALGQSRFLILLASPEAAASPWVGKEVAYWLEHKSADTLLIALTDGVLSWDDAIGDFGRREAMSLPAVLAGRFASEPKWVDLTAYRDGASTRDTKFNELAADFAAAIHGMPKEDLLSQEVRQQRRALRLASLAAVTLLILAGAAGWQWWEAEHARRAAVEQRQIAQQQRDRAEKTLATATETANTLVRDLASEFRHRTGMPVELVRKILERAQALQRQLTASGETAPDLRYSEAIALDELVLTLLSQGDAAGALAAAARARDILESLTAGNPGHRTWQRGLAIAYARIGEILGLVGRPQEEALEPYGRSLAIFLELAKAEPSNAARLQDLSIGYGRLGDALTAVGRQTQALKSYRIGLALLEQLDAASPNTEWKLSMTIAHDRIGDVFRMTGQPEEALEAYRSSLAIREKLVAADPDNSEWQRGLSISYERIGDMLAASKSQQEALEAYRKSLAITTKLAGADPGNAEWRRDLSLTYDRIGNVLVKTGDREGAVRTYRRSLAIREDIAAGDAGGAQSQNDLVISLMKLAQAGDEPRARYTRALAIGRRLEADGKLTASQKGRIKMIEDALDKLADGAGSPASAR